MVSPKVTLRLKKTFILLSITYITIFFTTDDPLSLLAKKFEEAYSRVYDTFYASLHPHPLSKAIEKSSYDFQWSDWVDLAEITKLEYGQNVIMEKYPQTLKFLRLQKFISPNDEFASAEDHATMASWYKKYNLTIPKQLVVLKTSKSGNLLNPRQRAIPLDVREVKSRDPKRSHVEFGNVKPRETSIPLSPPLVPELKNSPVDIVDLAMPPVPDSLFEFDAVQLSKGYNLEDPYHANTLTKSFEIGGKAPKYFFEPNIKRDHRSIGSHYDWRFFRHIIRAREHQQILHQLARGWQQFAENAGIVYWYAHGSLLGYYWNGHALPWDSDHDIQVPVMELERLARDFNRTLVVQSELDGGQRAFLLDINPYYAYRGRGNSLNFIDARFIDIKSGLFLDVAGLTKDPSDARTVKCRNNHAYNVKSFSRVRRTQFEGFLAMTPLRIEESLIAEYTRMKQDNFMGWRFNKKLFLWEPKSHCTFPSCDFDENLMPVCEKRLSTEDPIDREDFNTDDAGMIADHKLWKPAMDNYIHIEETYKNMMYSSDPSIVKSYVEYVGNFYPPVYSDRENVDQSVSSEV